MLIYIIIKLIQNLSIWISWIITSLHWLNFWKPVFIYIERNISIRVSLVLIGFWLDLFYLFSVYVFNFFVFHALYSTIVSYLIIQYSQHYCYELILSNIRQDVRRFISYCVSVTIFYFNKTKLIMQLKTLFLYTNDMYFWNNSCK